MDGTQKNRSLAGCAAVAACLACPGAGFAADVLAYAKVMLAKDAKLFKLVARQDPDTKAPYPLPPSLPSGATAELSVFVHDGPGGTFADPLTAGTWTALRGGSGYKYVNGAAPNGGAVKVLLVKAKVVKVLAKSDGTLLPGPIAGSVGVRLTIGADTYCASSSGGTVVKNVPAVWKSKDNPTPVACPSAPSCPPPAGCCNGAAFLGVTSGGGGGDCGDVLGQSGASFSQLTCGGLYLGGGSNSVPLPIPMPDMAHSIAAVTACSGQTATLGAATSAQTGSSRTCTAAGCQFGTPIPVPNSTSPFASVCVTNVLSGGVSGSADCAVGSIALNLPLGAVLYVTGDMATDPSGTIPGIQPCPLCSGGTCIGGANNGMACVPGNTTPGTGYPTSLDCPPAPAFLAGTLPIGFALTTGTVTWTATDATNDDGTGTPQARVFSGFCYDDDGTGLFANPARQCWENGMAVGPPCAGTFETCGQQAQGAFGPGGNGVRTITAVGAAAGSDLHCGSSGTLASLFSLAPTFNATVDGAASLPGPAAVTIPATLSLCAVANPCP
jgi:hypothetical protein